MSTADTQPEDCRMTRIPPHYEETVASLAADHARGAVVIDVREPAEYVTGHVSGAVLIPMGQVHEHLDEIPADGPVHVICRSGNRSLATTVYLRGVGRLAYSVAGGTMAWIAAGHPVVLGSNPSE